MTTRRRSFATPACLLWGMLLTPAAAQATADAALVRPALASVHVTFIENQGQVDPRVAYYAPTMAGTVFVTPKGELAAPSRR